MRKERGAITVFFSLVSVLFLSLICTAAESARIQEPGRRRPILRTWEIIPCLEEFEKRLLEEYEIFALDASYGTGDFSMGPGQ